MVLHSQEMLLEEYLLELSLAGLFAGIILIMSGIIYLAYVRSTM